MCTFADLEESLSFGSINQKTSDGIRHVVNAAGIHPKFGGFHFFIGYLWYQGNSPNDFSPNYVYPNNFSLKSP
jgi:hypothetical protein